MANEAQVEPMTDPPLKKNTLKFASGFLKPNSLSHFLLWREGSGFTFAILLGLLQWGTPLHLSGEWQTWQLVLTVIGSSAITAWYPNAQANAVQFAMRDEGVLDPEQVNRDFGWSILPALVIGGMYLLTAVGFCLHFLTDIFDEPSSWWIRDRLIISPLMFGYSLIALFMVKVDIGNNNTVLSQVVQLAGRLRRFEN